LVNKAIASFRSRYCLGRIVKQRKKGGGKVDIDSSFDEIYEVMFPLIYRFVAVRVPKCDVEDVVAEIIVKVWKGLANVENQNALKAWAFKIASRHIVDYYRSNKSSHTVALDEITQNLTQAADHSENLATVLDVGEALAMLPPQQVNVIQLRLIEGFSAAEAAEILGTTDQAVDSLLYRAKKSFRKAYLGSSGKGGRD